MHIKTFLLCSNSANHRAERKNIYILFSLLFFLVDLINLFEVSFYFNAKYPRLGFGFDYWGKVHFANVMIQQPFSFTHNESSNQEPWTCRCDICHDHLCCLQQGTEKGWQRNCLCESSQKERCPLAFESTFFSAVMEISLLMSWIGELSSTAKCRGESCFFA